MQTDWENNNNMQKRYQALSDRVANICKQAGRRVEDVHLIAVSKTKPIEDIMAAKALGLADFGENKVQELRKKILQVPDVRWHFIGHLQTNKVKYIIDDVTLIHSLDRWHLAQEIEKQAATRNRQIEVLIQVNVAGEESKFGLEPNEVVDFYRDLHQLSHIKVAGLMTMAPFCDKAEDVRYVFRRLALLRETLVALQSKRMTPYHLSMGMSRDYHVAIEEGATMIRVGTALFGKRE